MKVCNRCREIKGLDCFGSSGKALYCKKCCNLTAKQSRDRRSQTKIDEYNLKRREYRVKNKERINAVYKARLDRIPGLRAKKNKLYRQRHPGKVAARVRLRNMLKSHATPPWVSEEQILQMAYIYQYSTELSRIFGTRFNVDHIYPLKGKTVCGLHLPENLQILTDKENSIKLNKMPDISLDYLYDRKIINKNEEK